ncbi:MAG: hypothetical protein HKN23_14025 [Verrucomicrobiales bacterium]|nr:hypothetical protein [Verrucomicrobiales bacterium]
MREVIRKVCYLTVGCDGISGKIPKISPSIEKGGESAADAAFGGTVEHDHDVSS